MIVLLNSRDIELHLDASGKVIKNLSLSNHPFTIKSGSMMLRYIDASTHVYFLEKLLLCNQTGFSFGHELLLNYQGNKELISFVLYKSTDFLVFINLNESQKTMRILEDVIKINNELINQIRASYHSGYKNERENADFKELSKLNSELVNVQRTLTKKNIELNKLNSLLESLTYKDDLTGIANRRKFFKDIKAMKIDTTYKLIMIDFNHFKVVNDTRGHEYGDYVLKTFSTELNQLLKPCGGVLYRIGGDEFAILIERTLCSDFNPIATHINKQLHNLHEAISIAYGVGEVSHHLLEETKIERLMSIIDQQMYMNKSHMKNNL